MFSGDGRSAAPACLPSASLTIVTRPKRSPDGTVDTSCSIVPISPSLRWKRKTGCAEPLGTWPEASTASTIVLTRFLTASGSRPGGSIRLQTSQAGKPTISAAVWPVRASASGLQAVTFPCSSVRTAAEGRAGFPLARPAFPTLSPLVPAQPAPPCAPVADVGVRPLAAPAAWPSVTAPQRSTNH